MAQQEYMLAGAQKDQTSHPPNPGAPRLALSQARPQRAKMRGRALRCVKPLSDARTPLAGFFSILLQIPTAFDRLEQRHFVGILDIHPDRNAIGDTGDPRTKRFQLVR